MALNATPGSATADSYLTVAAADTMATNFGLGGWATKTTAQKEAALRQATLDVDGHRFHNQVKWTAGQSRVFPRVVDVGVIPADVELATMFQADFLASHGEWDRKDWDGAKAAPHPASGAGSPLCNRAFKVLARWIARTGEFREASTE
jgi:hypothetical protein